MVTDYDSWRDEEAGVEASEVVATLAANAARAPVAALATMLSPDHAPSPPDTALDGAILTPPDARDPDLAVRLAPILARLSAATASRAT